MAAESRTINDAENDGPASDTSDALVTGSELHRPATEGESASAGAISTSARATASQPAVPLVPPSNPPPPPAAQVYDSPSLEPLSDATVVHRPRLTPCSLNPSTWSKRRTKVAACGCFSSAAVCTIRLLLDPGPSAYVIHSIIILVDMVLIHVFTYSPGLSMVGELTAILFASLYHVTHQKVFELLETTLIAVWVSIHMIRSRDEHWDREEELEKDIVGLHFYIEHRSPETGGKLDASERRRRRSGSGLSRRRSSGLSKSENGVPGRGSEAVSELEHDEEAGGDLMMHQSTRTGLSSFTHTSRHPTDNVMTSKSERNHWWHHFFDHFLDGSAGVMYTSFLGLIIDEIVNINSKVKY